MLAKRSLEIGDASIALEKAGLRLKMKRPAEGSAAVMCVGGS